MFTVVIPHKYEDVIQPLLASIKRKLPKEGLHTPIVFVADGHDRNYGFKSVPYNESHFSFSRAVNIGIRSSGEFSDIILLNDDCVILEWNFFERLAQLAYAHEKIGILSPLVVGCVGNPLQRWYERDQFWTPDRDFIDVPSPNPVCFPCVYIKRIVFNTAGMMNEWIASYGRDDDDMCERARAAGWRTTVTQRLIVQHGDGSADLGSGRGTSWNASFMRRYGGTPTEVEIREYHDRLLKEGKPAPEPKRANVRYFKE